MIIHDLYPSDEILGTLKNNGIEYVLVDNETERDDGLTIEIDHYWNSATLYPRISCLCHPREQVGKEAVTMIVDRINGNMEPRKTVLRGTLFIGDTGK